MTITIDARASRSHDDRGGRHNDFVTSRSRGLNAERHAPGALSGGSGGYSEKR
jgi:hypothetical protein